MHLVFDIDGVLCDEHEDDISKRQPYTQRIAQINKLVDEGHTVDIFTSRGMKSTDNANESGLKYRGITELQLKLWGVRYNKLYFGKPNADVYIDNKNELLDFFDKLSNPGSNGNSNP